MGKCIDEINCGMFGSAVFSDAVMQERLPKPVYKKLKKTIKEGLPLDPDIAEVVACVMKDWAVEMGATHFTHWFQPLTGVTAEKHDSFLSPTGDGKAIMEFSGKELIKGEPDASSFPSGGLRATFEARGYTAWDCTSPAFVKDKTLYIPTAFCSYTGEALDLKTPLLRSMEALSKQALRILRLFGDTTTKRVVTTLGPEQEYFLVDKEKFMQRKDLIYTGRTLFGAKPPKGQELEDHYFGIIKEKISRFMHDLDAELWKLGVSAKTKHNEVAPAQHELAPVFATTNIATDHNQLTMEIMKKVADRHGLACLLHEKPFAGVNGSGKHNNWSISTDDGRNLLDPGTTPSENAQFLIFLVAVIKAVDDYADLLRFSVATAGNDHRLGANEAPPAIMSIFLGDELTNVIEEIETGVVKNNGTSRTLEIGVSTLPVLPKDNTDRNRTSPFAFTGNKFEFRSVGSSQSIATPNFIINTIVAETLSQIADRLEKAQDFKAEVNAVVKEIIKNHKRIIFNGNNYSEEWVAEAERRGLPNLKTTVDAIPVLIAEKNIKVLEKHGVLNRAEVLSRYEICLENYVKTIRIEALTMIEMASRQILPASLAYVGKVADTVASLKAAGADSSFAKEELDELVSLTSSLKAAIDKLSAKLEEVDAHEGDSLEHARAYKDVIIPLMNELRAFADKLETMVDASLWPIPTYGDLLFSVI
ncbi:glutamine synthetase [Acetivibrio thermocellus AD2]|jgi:glutamine synthetase|uniref:Glutamine synthetase n=1 Tax=Acetivibrio thermocellus AD2 TaxID=1138384 RepID=A0AB36TKD5_ACETH|nr:glutamine synthetase III [Acetivibrio thermocellus]ADU75330.1 glutamine synthetase catalytic region [Acetivibrio thermocellus DSM 1313]ALX09323.1 Glutamine synthetase type III domain-containing protein [Acetivibrio thermocellus AD2]ANV77077.1 Glutamine synthetase type III domain-containing protein [Acetivibrio thermocellus DSM 2360]EIC04650.1 glutamine synthetase catalytic region [Acetivibrio thermocellus YS]PFH03600.1 glutamine synthetase [Acetivibrio thermocellus AD2]